MSEISLRNKVDLEKIIYVCVNSNRYAKIKRTYETPKLIKSASNCIKLTEITRELYKSTANLPLFSNLL